MPEHAVGVVLELSAWAVKNDVKIHTQLSWMTKFSGIVRLHTTAMATDRAGVVVVKTITTEVPHA